jgi:hypothetical protein
VRPGRGVHCRGGSPDSDMRTQNRKERANQRRQLIQFDSQHELNGRSLTRKARFEQLGIEERIDILVDPSPIK